MTVIGTVLDVKNGVLDVGYVSPYALGPAATINGAADVTAAPIKRSDLKVTHAGSRVRVEIIHSMCINDFLSDHTASAPAVSDVVELLTPLVIAGPILLKVKRERGSYE